MNNRLTIHDLAAILATKTGKDKKSVELFIREFIRIVTENIYSDKLVKVKGLGSFKIIPVEKRESIHVNTGERIVIPAHYKFSFHPDKELREVVNQPFSFFETTELNPGVEFTIPDEEPEVIETIAPTPEEITEAVPVSEPEEQLPQESIQEDVKPEEKKENLPKEEETIPPDPIATLLPEDNQSVTQPTAKNKGSLYPLIATIVATILVTAGGLYYYLQHHHNNGSFQRKSENIKNTISSVDNSNNQPETSGREEVLLSDSIQPREEPDLMAEQPTEEDTSPGTDIIPPVAEELPTAIATVKIEPGSRLTLIALDHYGHKLFWVYIYEYNKSIIADPNNIPVGTVLKLPAKNLYDIDARNRKSLEKAAIKQTEILTGFQ